MSVVPTVWSARERIYWCVRQRRQGGHWAKEGYRVSYAKPYGPGGPVFATEKPVLRWVPLT